MQSEEQNDSRLPKCKWDDTSHKRRGSKEKLGGGKMKVKQLDYLPSIAANLSSECLFLRCFRRNMELRNNFPHPVG